MRFLPWGAVLVGAGVVGAGVLIAAGSGEDEPGVVEPTGFLAPLAVGPANDPEIASLLQEMRDEFVSEGVDLSVVTPEEVTRMRKAPGKPFAIPQRVYWPRMIYTIKTVFEPIRMLRNVPFNITNGYRAPDYNEAVGGEENSRHQAFEAIDFRPASDAHEIAMDLARLYLDEGDALEMGLGIYGWPATSFHIDTGTRQRKWKNTGKYLDLVRQKA